MSFWKEHAVLRMILLLACLFAGIALIVFGWKMTGTLTGLGTMLLGVALLIMALLIYNKPFEDKKAKKSI